MSHTPLETWAKMSTGQHLDDWLELGEVLLMGRRLAMRIAHTNQPTGKGYNIAFGGWQLAHGFHTIPKSAISDLLWILDNGEHRAILREQRATMTVSERARLNSPSAARQRVAKILKAREAKVSDMHAPANTLRGKLRAAQHTIADLEERLAAAEGRDGSLFDLQKDTGKVIGRVIAENVGESKWREIEKAAKALFEERRKLLAAKHAG